MNSPHLIPVGIHRTTHAQLASMKRDELDTFDTVIQRLIISYRKKREANS